MPTYWARHVPCSESKWKAALSPPAPPALEAGSWPPRTRILVAALRAEPANTNGNCPFGALRLALHGSIAGKQQNPTCLIAEVGRVSVVVPFAPRCLCPSFPEIPGGETSGVQGCSQCYRVRQVGLASSFGARPILAEILQTQPLPSCTPHADTAHWRLPSLFLISLQSKRHRSRACAPTVFETASSRSGRQRSGIYTRTYCAI